MTKVRHYPTTERPFLALAERGVLRVRQATVQGYIECRSPGVFDAAYPTSELRRARVKEGGQFRAHSWLATASRCSSWSMNEQ